MNALPETGSVGTARRYGPRQSDEVIVTVAAVLLRPDAGADVDDRSEIAAGNAPVSFR